MGWFKECRKWTVLIFNLLFLVIGITLIVLGALGTHNFNNISKLVPSSYNYITTTPIIFLVVGSVLVLVSILGSIGVRTWSLFLLNTYTIALLIIFFLHIILSIVTFLAVSNQSDLAQNINSTILEVFQNYSKNNESIDFIQTKLECCGTSGPSFWAKFNLTLPESCCAGDCSKSVYHKGCQVEFYDFVMSSIRFIGTTILALSPLQVIGATFSLSLVNSIRNFERRYGKYIK